MSAGKGHHRNKRAQKLGKHQLVDQRPTAHNIQIQIAYPCIYNHPAHL